MPFHVHFKGRVVDAETGEPIAGVTVTLRPAQRGTGSANTAKSGPDGALAWKPLIAFNKLAPQYSGSNAVPAALRDARQPLLDPLHYNVSAHADGYKTLTPVAVAGAKPKRWAKSLPMRSSYTDAIHTWIDIRMVKGNRCESIDSAKQFTSELRGVRDEAATVAEAKKVWKSGDFATAVRLYRELAEQGNAWAMVELGYAHYVGRGVEQNKAEAAALFRRAAEQGYSRAQYNLAWLLLRGEGVEVDDAEAVKWLTKGAEQGNAEAQNELGFLYMNGRGVSKDPKLGAALYRKAAEQGHAKAQRNLAVAYVQGTGVAQDRSEALHWFMEGAARGEKTCKQEAEKLRKAGVKPPPASPSADPKPTSPTPTPPMSPKPATPPVVPDDAPKPAAEIDYSDIERVIVYFHETERHDGDAGVRVYYAESDYRDARGRERKDPVPFTGLIVYHHNMKKDRPIYIKQPHNDGKAHGVGTAWFVEKVGEKYVRKGVHRNTPYQHGLRHGLWKENDKQGRLYQSWEYRNGKQHGVTTIHHDNGRVASETTYVDGTEKTTRRYDRNGTLKSEKKR